MPGPPVYDDGEVLLYGDGPIVLAGHLDTIPAQGNLPGRIDGGAVHGLGASDMKSGVAVMIELARAGVPGRYLFFTREEIPVSESPLPALFATGLLRDAELAVVLEPTDCELHAGCLGNLQARITFHGESAHSARPWTGVNAIHELVRGPAAARRPRAGRRRAGRARLPRGGERRPRRRRHRVERRPRDRFGRAEHALHARRTPRLGCESSCPAARSRS